MIGRTNTGGGGGGLSPNSAVIHVTAPAGSTISFAKGGVTAKVLGPEKSHVSADDTTLAEWYYAVSSSNYGSWTVTATLGTDTASDTVTIDSNKEYEVELAYQLVLFENGTISPVVGTFNTFSSASVGTTIKCMYNNDNGAGFTTQESINLADYSELIFEFTGYTKNPSYPLIIGVTSIKIDSGKYSANNYKFSVRHDPNAGDTTAIIDISSANSGYIAGCGIGTIEISKIYLK